MAGIYRAILKSRFNIARFLCDGLGGLAWRLPKISGSTTTAINSVISDDSFWRPSAPAKPPAADARRW
jgi:hypothetical protein